MIRRSGFGSQLRPTANARSGLVYVFHRAEKKLGGSCGSYSSTASALEQCYSNYTCFSEVQNMLIPPYITKLAYLKSIIFF